jgi:hypothetical protein
MAQNKFKVEEVAVNDLLIGNLYAPENVVKPNLVILIAGSGIPDRDGNSPGVKNNALKLLAEGIANDGTAVYSFDKRTIAMLKASDFKEESLNFDIFIADVKDIIAYFKKTNTYGKIILAGHSEGSLIGMVAAKSNADGYISIAGAGRTIDLIITDQIVSQSPALKQEVEQSFMKLKKGETFVLENQNLASIFRPSVQPFMISWIKYNPQEEIKKLAIPTLIINGSNDIQVGVNEAELLHKASPKSTLVIIDSMNHVLRIVAGGRQENIDTYNNPELPVSKYLVSVVNKFLKSL